MRREIQITIGLSVLLLNVALVFGQGKVIDKKNYTEIVEKAFNNLKTNAYRVSSTIEVFEAPNSSPGRRSEIKMEFAPPDRYRYVTESLDYGSNKIIVDETIIVGQKKYTKRTGGDWRIEELSVSSNANINRSEKIDAESYKIFENITLNGKKVTVYEAIQRKTYSYPNNQTAKETLTTKSWISQEGMLMKIEHKTQPPGSQTIVYTSNYEYDSTIEIEAPSVTLKRR